MVASTTPTNERTQAPLRYADLKPHMAVRLTGFTCLPPGDDLRYIYQDTQGGFYVWCRGPDCGGGPASKNGSAKHYLDGQRISAEDDTLTGVTV